MAEPWNDVKIRYSEAILDKTNTGDECHFEQRGLDEEWDCLPRLDCLGAGFTCNELARAVAKPGTWIACPRETTVTGDASEIMSGLQADVERLTEQRDALLAACKRGREFIGNMEHVVEFKFPIILSMFDDAIALREKAKAAVSEEG